MEFVRRENLRLYRKQLAKETDEARRRQLIRLLAAEEAEAQSNVGNGHCDALAHSFASQLRISRARSP